MSEPILFRWNKITNHLMVLFPERPANNVASNIAVWMYHTDMIGVDEDYLRENTVDAYRFPELELDIQFMLAAIRARSYDIWVARRFLRRFKLVRHSKLYLADKEQREAL